MSSLPEENPDHPMALLDTDVASFNDLWIAADLIETCCLGAHRPGWASAGKPPLFRFLFPYKIPASL